MFCFQCHVRTKTLSGLCGKKILKRLHSGYFPVLPCSQSLLLKHQSFLLIYSPFLSSESETLYSFSLHPLYYLLFACLGFYLTANKRINKFLPAILIEFHYPNVVHYALSPFVFHSRLFVFAPPVHKKIILRDQKTWFPSSVSLSSPEICFSLVPDLTVPLTYGGDTNTEVQQYPGVNWKGISEQKGCRGRGRSKVSPMLLKGNSSFHGVATHSCFLSWTTKLKIAVKREAFNLVQWHNTSWGGICFFLRKAV